MNIQTVKKNLFQIYIVVMMGIIISMAGTAMLISGSFNLAKFYNVDDIYDIPQSTLKLGGEGLAYNFKENCLEIQADTSKKVIEIAQKQQGKWNYIYINIDKLSKENLDVNIQYYNNSDEMVYETNKLLVTGKNLIYSNGVSYSKVYFVFEKQKGEQFNIKKIQFSKQEITFNIYYAVLYFVFLFIVYLAVQKLIVNKLKKINFKISFYSLIEKLQKLYIKFGDFAGVVSLKLNTKMKHKIRIFLFTMLFIYMEFMSSNNLYLNTNYFKYHMYLSILAIIIIALSCYEKPLHLTNWNSRYVKAWFTLWIIAVISEFIVPKRYLFQGLIMIFVMSFFYFMWNNMDDMDTILIDLRNSLKWWFLINILPCYFLRPYIQGTRYMGMTKNPNILAMGLIFVMAAFLSEFEIYIRKKEQLFTKDILLNLVSIGIAFDFILKTGSSSGLLPTLLLIFVFVIRQIKYIKNKKTFKQLGYLALSLLIIIIAYRISDIGLNNIPVKVSEIINYEYKTDIIITENELKNPFKLEVRAGFIESIKNNRVYQKLLNSTSFENFTSARNLFWLGYIRELNLWGHEFAPMLWGGRRSAHNAVLAIAYRYGVFAVIPYLIILFYYFKFSILYKEKKENYSGIEYFVKALALNLVILLMVENVEFPFYYISWYCLYLFIGYNFGNNESLVK